MLVSCDELFQNRRSSIDDKGVVSHNRSWQVIFDDVNDGTAAALMAPGVPRFNSVGPDNTRARTIESNPVDRSDMVFQVDVGFSGGVVDEQALYPTDRPPEFSWPGQEYTEAWFYDYSKPNRKAYCNSAGDSFESTSERIKGELVITMLRNEEHWDVLANDELTTTVNADIVFLDGQAYGKGTLLMGVPTATKVAEVWMGQVIEYFKVTRTFKARKAGWADRPLDYGFNEVREYTKRVDGVLTLVKERHPIYAAGTKTNKPWPLKNGKAMPSATDIPDALEFLPYEEKSWASLYLS